MKVKLRKQMRAARRSLAPADHRLRSRLAAAAIARTAAFKSGSRVALYLPFDGETDTAALIAAARRRGVRVFVPVVSDLRHRRLRFYPLTGRTRRGTFGILVPHCAPHRPARAVAPRWFDLIVVPLVAVDPHGRRLGMGGGFYDRALGFRRHRSHWMGPRLVGFAFGRQRTDRVFAEPWDVRLDALATESGYENFPKDAQ
jgi:5-formyltetrahydrofolate cyclo-ligase